MRVVQLGPYPPPHGGVQTNLVAIRDYLCKQGIPCAVINITRHRRPEADEVYYPKSALGLIRDLFRRRYDIVHLHIGGIMPLRVVALAFVCTCVPWAKAILTFHSGGYPSSDEGRAAKKISVRGFVLRRFRFLIGVNEEIIDFYLKLGVPRSRTRLIPPHSVSVTTLAEGLEEPLVSFFAQHGPVLVSVCGLKPEYDLPRQIEALGYILRKHPKAGLAVIGSGPLEASLRVQINSTPYARHVLLCGDVPHPLTLSAIAGADVLLRTTLYDGDAISIREALFLGTPVIATDNGMRPEGVHLIPIGDTEALVRAVESVSRNGVERRPPPGNDEQNLAKVLALYYEATGTKSQE
ncbi:MAG: glycosyltransferase family 4 protein [Acidobacteriaceae bacterium]|nr:glycosyltransferase family 4 protein [Acidobacteriaceae bacterium]MBV9778533.1 glycosyltransferase family 4 protein [Acidobacteriaceae bacterium]